MHCRNLMYKKKWQFSFFHWHFQNYMQRFCHNITDQFEDQGMKIHYQWTKLEPKEEYIQLPQKTMRAIIRHQLEIHFPGIKFLVDVLESKFCRSLTFKFWFKFETQDLYKSTTCRIVHTIRKMLIYLTFYPLLLPCINFVLISTPPFCLRPGSVLGNFTIIS